MRKGERKMGFEGIGTGAWTDTFHQYQDEIIGKIKKGTTEDEILIGGTAFTQTEWKKVLEGVDEQLENGKEEQKQRFEKQEKKAEAARIYEAAQAGKENWRDLLRTEAAVPYGYLAKNGLIQYHGTVFVCDEQTNSICLGDMNDKKNVLTIPLSGGGCLKVNRDNLGDLQNAIGMFSPEDVNRILRAIAQDNKVREKQLELEETKNGENLEQTES